VAGSSHAHLAGGRRNRPRGRDPSNAAAGPLRRTASTRARPGSRSAADRALMMCRHLRHAGDPCPHLPRAEVSGAAGPTSSRPHPTKSTPTAPQIHRGGDDARQPRPINVVAAPPTPDTRALDVGRRRPTGETDRIGRQQQRPRHRVPIGAPANRVQTEPARPRRRARPGGPRPAGPASVVGSSRCSRCRCCCAPATRGTT
jgi:hypothetical protein